MSPSRRLSRVLASVALVAAPLAAQGAAADLARSHDIVLDDYFTLATPIELAVSADGARVVTVELRWEPENDARNADLWLTEVASGARARLAADPAWDEAPVFAPDGESIYFLSARRRGDGAPPWNGRKQVFRVAAAAGAAAQPITSAPGGVESFQLSADGRGLYCVLDSPWLEDGVWGELKREFPELGYAHGRSLRSQLWRVDLASGAAERLVDPGRKIRAFAVAGDGGRVALITTPDEREISFEGRSWVQVWDAASGRLMRLPDELWRAGAPSPNGWIEQPCWNDAGDALAFRVDFDGYPSEIFVAGFGGGGRNWLRRVERGGEVHPTGALRWRPGGDELCFSADQRARARIVGVPGAARREGGGALRVLTPGDVVAEPFAFAAAAGALFAIVGGPAFAEDVFAVGPDGALRQLTELNPQMRAWRLPRLELLRWRGAGGVEVEGVLELPPDWRPGDGPLPALIELHGGPTASTYFAFRYWIYGRTLWAARGWAVLSPNYRGSTGYGDRFMTDLIGRKNDLDVKDILSGVDALVARGVADPERLAVIGWSNGGYLVNCLIAATDRFRAASSGAGEFDTVMQWATEDTPGHVVNFARGLPWEAGAALRRTSPIYRAGAIRTPTLIHAGTHDARVPVQHGLALHRALYDYLGVPVELVLYPGAGHSLSSYRHRRAKLAWDQAWFDHWVN